MLFATAGAGAQSRPEPLADVSARVLSQLFGVPDTLQPLRMSLTDLKRAFPSLRPLMAGIQHQIWGARSADGVEVHFMIAADATSDAPPADSVSRVEFLLATSNASLFRQVYATITQSIPHVRTPYRCERNTVLREDINLRWVNFAASWQTEVIGTAFSAVISHGSTAAITQSGYAPYRLQFTTFLRSDLLITPSELTRTDAGCPFRPDELRSRRR